MSDSKENSFRWRESEAKLEELNKSIMDVLAGFRNMEREIKMGMVGMAKEIDKLDASLKDVREGIKNEVKEQVDEYLKQYLDDLPGGPVVHSRHVIRDVALPQRPRSSKSTVPPPRFRRNVS